MDYSRIYKSFIRSRRQKESSLKESGKYFETHHINPRCLGGDDDPENLVALSPSDHFFAHLLLAKIHGGKLWAPVAFMCGGSRSLYVPTVSRNKYAWALEAMGRSRAGENAYQFDREVYKLVRKNGDRWQGLQINMHEIGLSKSMANMLVKGALRTAKGWRLESQTIFERGGENHPMYRSERYTFIHDNGEVFTGTQYDLHLYKGLSKSACSQLANRKRVVASGWRLEGSDRNYRRGKNCPGSSLKTITIIHKDGKEQTGIPSDLYRMIGGSRGNFSQMITGKRKNCKGWRLK